MAEITQDGIVKKSYEEYLLEIQDGWRTIFGENMVFGAETPQGQITSLMALMASDFENQIVDVGRSLDISQARGQQLDDLTSLMSVFRLPASKSAVDTTMTGVEGTVIPAGSKASLVSGESFSLRDSVSIDSSLSVSGYFIADGFGAIAIGADALNVITTPIVGWDSITNPLAGTTGSEIETDAELTRRYYNELFVNSQSLMNSIVSGVQSIPDVIQASGFENDTPYPHDIGSDSDLITIPAHGFIVVVEGGAAQDIADKIYQYKSIGSNSQQLVEVIIYSTTGTTIPAGSVFTLPAANNENGGDFEFRSLVETVLPATTLMNLMTSPFTSDNLKIDGTIAPDLDLIHTIPNLELATIGLAYNFTNVLVDSMSPSGDFVMQEIPISFLRVVEVPVQMEITIVTNELFPIDGITQIKENLLAYFNGSDVFTDRFELTGLDIAEDVAESRLYTPVNMVQGHSISTFLLNTVADWDGGAGLQIIPISINQRATLDESNISIITS